jgi:hypothetical protein
MVAKNWNKDFPGTLLEYSFMDKKSMTKLRRRPILKILFVLLHTLVIDGMQ